MGVFAGADPLGAPFRAAVGGVLGEFVAGHATLLTAVAPQLGSLIELAQVFTAGGKRLRPAFCWWGYAAVAEPSDPDALVRAAASLDLLHVSALVHEPRGEGTDVSPRMPTDEVAAAVTHMQRLWSDVEDLETEHGLTPTGAPDAGIAWAMHRWASGRDLDQVLRGSDLTAGDFVRRCKQVVDLLGQVADAADDAEVRRTARKAMDAILRGVVATD